MHILTKARHHLRHRFRDRFPDELLPDTPHFDAESDAFFADTIARVSSYVEYGGGGSTVVAVRRGARTVTVETSPGFLKALKRRIGRAVNWTPLFVDIGPVGSWGRPIFTEPTLRRLRAWRSYPSAPYRRGRSAGEMPEFVLIDGRFRVACALEAARAVAHTGSPTTLMLDDYEQRTDRYGMVEDYLGLPERVGRAAIFRVAPATIKRVPDASEIANAALDFL